MLTIGKKKIIGRKLLFFVELHTIGTVCFGKSDMDNFIFGGRYIFADKVRSYGDFPVSSVNHNRKLNFCRTPERKQSVERCPCSSACIDNIICKNNCFSVNVFVSVIVVIPVGVPVT